MKWLLALLGILPSYAPDRDERMRRLRTVSDRHAVVAIEAGERMRDAGFRALHAPRLQAIDLKGATTSAEGILREMQGKPPTTRTPPQGQ